MGERSVAGLRRRLPAPAPIPIITDWLEESDEKANYATVPAQGSPAARENVHILTPKDACSPPADIEPETTGGYQAWLAAHNLQLSSTPTARPPAASVIFRDRHHEVEFNGSLRISTTKPSEGDWESSLVTRVVYAPTRSNGWDSNPSVTFHCQDGSKRKVTRHDNSQTTPEGMVGQKYDDRGYDKVRCKNGGLYLKCSTKQMRDFLLCYLQRMSGAI